MLPVILVTTRDPEHGWLEYELYKFPFGAQPIFRGELLVLGSVLLVREPSQHNS